MMSPRIDTLVFAAVLMATTAYACQISTCSQPCYQSTTSWCPPGFDMSLFNSTFLDRCHYWCKNTSDPIACYRDCCRCGCGGCNPCCRLCSDCGHPCGNCGHACDNCGHACDNCGHYQGCGICESICHPGIHHHYHLHNHCQPPPCSSFDQRPLVYLD